MDSQVSHKHLSSNSYACLIECLVTGNHLPLYCVLILFFFSVFFQVPVSFPGSCSPLDSSLDDPTFTFNLDFEGLVAGLLEDSDQHRHLFLSTTTSSSRDCVVTSSDVTFFIFTDFKEGSSSSLDLTKLEITVVGPTGCLVSINQKTRLSDRIAVVCRPLIPGRHTIKVYHGQRHIQGSPSELLVSKNYLDATNRRPIVTMDLELKPDPTNSPAATTLERRKPWGVACNANTEQVRTNFSSLVHVFLDFCV